MTTLNDQINEIKTHVFVAESEVNSLITGRKASASRVRKSLQEVKKLSHLLRKAVIEHVKLLPVKTRVSPIEKPTPASMGERPIEKPSPANIDQPMTIAFKRKRTAKRDPTM